MEPYFSIRKPTSSLLQPYIQWFYFQKENNDIGPKEIFFYPSTYTTLSIYQNAQVTIQGMSTYTKHQAQNKWAIYYTGYHRECGNATIETPFSKVGIVFTPLGFNQFIKGDLHTLVGDDEIVHFPHFGEALDSILPKLFDTIDEDDKVQVLSSFFESQLHTFEVPVLKDVVEYIIQHDEKLHVTDIANHFNIDRKQLLRLFKKHLNVSVKDFLTILSFSKVINSYLEKGEQKSLTQLIYRFGYYDQSNFTNDFKKIVGTSPKKILNVLKQTSEEEQFWKK